MEINLIVAFLSGLFIGATPCILLMMSTFGSSLILVEKKRKFLNISIGLISGMILAYILISLIFVFFFEILDAFTLFSYIFALILIIIGAWQIVEAKKEKSVIFGTPQKVKTVLKSFIDKNSGIYSFLVGIIFVLIKIPCFGSVYLALLYNFYKSPLFMMFIIFYLIGMLIPIIGILITLRIGLESSKVNEFRESHRASLRIISGAVLIFLAIYLLFLDEILFA